MISGNRTPKIMEVTDYNKIPATEKYRECRSYYFIFKKRCALLQEIKLIFPEKWLLVLPLRETKEFQMQFLRVCYDLLSEILERYEKVGLYIRLGTQRVCLEEQQTERAVSEDYPAILRRNSQGAVD